MILNIFISVFSGVITAWIIFLLAQFFRKIVVPWYQAIRYEGVDINGTWKHEVATEISNGCLTLNFKQNAHRLTGSAHLKHTSAEKEKELTYTLEGSLWEGYASMTLKSSDRKRISFATLLVKVVQGGKQLEGAFSYRNIKTDDVSFANIVLVRK